PHCGKAFHDTWNEIVINGERRIPGVRDFPLHQWSTNSTICPSCRNITITLVASKLVDPNARITGFEKVVYPRSAFRKPIPSHVPADIAADYDEACQVLGVSEKASAALSRRCMQAILRKQGYTQKDLVQQVQAALNEPDTTRALPASLRLAIDAIRNFGNFSAHPITDQTTL